MPVDLLLVQHECERDVPLPIVADASEEDGREVTWLFGVPCRKMSRKPQRPTLGWLALSVTLHVLAALGCVCFAPRVAGRLSPATEQRWRKLQAAAVEFGEHGAGDRGPIYYEVPKLRPPVRSLAVLPTPAELPAAQPPAAPPSARLSPPVKLAKTLSPGSPPAKKAPPAPNNATPKSGVVAEPKPGAPKGPRTPAALASVPPPPGPVSAGPEFVLDAPGAAPAKGKPQREAARSAAKSSPAVSSTSGRVGWAGAAPTRRAGAGSGAPRLIDNPPPEYPPEALAARQSGRVLLRVAVRADGSVDHAALYRTSGVDALDQAALRIIPRWRFAPREIPGDVWEVVVPIRFVLEEE